MGVNPLHLRNGLIPLSQSDSSYNSPWRLEFGARPVLGGVQFQVWAPNVREISLHLRGPGGSRDLLPAPGDMIHPMHARDDGIFQMLVPGLAAGTDYFYALEGGRYRPDPVSRAQPYGVHGPSRVADSGAFAWHDSSWEGFPLEQYVIYELHVGCFTSAGTFAAIIEKLDYLRALGVTAVELMPVAQFAGSRNWGYDGVDLYAPHTAYGGGDGLKSLVDACHRAGLAVIIDVVYNHLGPEGNYLADFGPYFTRRYHSPWGEALNFDGAMSDGVRRFFVDNALYWLTEYHADALRLDAIHAIFDFGARHLLRQMADEFQAQAAALGRRAFLIAESDLNDVRVINPVEFGGYGLDAQWNDDFHHALHTLITDSRHGYFTDFGAVGELRKALTEGYVYDGRYSRFRQRCHGNSAAPRPGRQFVVFNQNHDQIANACGGARLSQLVSSAALKLAAVMLMCAPNLPMLFMGEEFGISTPFFYFTSFPDPELGHAVSAGRRNEYADFFCDEPFPDPQDQTTFMRSKLEWSQAAVTPHREILALNRTLVALRKANPSLGNCRKDLTLVHTDERARWLVLERGDASAAALVLANFAQEPRDIPAAWRAGKWRLKLWTNAIEFGGDGGEEPAAMLESNSVRMGAFGAAVYFREEAR
ncbi:MAG: malto-oligosyltrehalose trehalohydrolase [Candidatus Binataceae bacterium]